MFNSDEDKSHQIFALKLNLSWQALRARRARSWARPRGLDPGATRLITSQGCRPRSEDFMPVPQIQET